MKTTRTTAQVTMADNKTLLKIEGMNCASCASKVEKAAMEVVGVSKAQVNLPAKSLTYWFEGEVPTEEVITKVSAAGYPASLPKTSLRIGFLVENMNCAGCQSKVNKAVASVKGAEHFNVNLMTKRLSLDYDPSQLDLEELKSTLEKAGYPLIETIRDEVTESLLPPFAKELKEQKQKLFFAAIFAFPLFFIAMGEMLGLHLPEILSPKINPLNFAALQILILLPVVWVGRDFYSLGFKHLIRKSPNMDSLIAVGTTSAIAFSLYHSFLILQGNVSFVNQLYYETAAVIITLILFGRYLEGLSKEKSFGAIKELIGLQSKEARLIQDGKEVMIAQAEVIPSDVLWVKSGETIPVDGFILSGEGELNESMMTGESRLQAKAKGAEVIGGCILASGHLEIQATKIGKDSTLSKMISLVEEAQNSKAPIARKADIVASYFVPAVMIIALISGLAWFTLGYGAAFSVKIFIAVLVIACPCALGLATPTAILVGTSKGAKLGILIKGGESLERLCDVQDLIFDKTGTLTLGEPEVAEIHPVGSMQPEDLLSLAASLEKGSEHIYAQAIIKKAEELQLSYPLPSEIKIHAGRGIEGQVEGKTLHLGNPTLMKELQVFAEPPLEASQKAEGGKTIVFIAEGKTLLGYLALQDQIRPEAKEAMQALKNLGMTPHMLTGDNQQTANEVGALVGISEIYAEVLPADKMQIIKDLQAKGRVVAMVGDGINDAPALTQADVGIALGSGTEVSMESAQMVLLESNLMAVSRGVRLSKATLTNIKQNLFWAFGYNTLGIPFAAGLFYPSFGLTLNPMIAALAMAFSSVSVVTNALRLHRFK